MCRCNLIITRKKQIVASLALCKIIIDGIDYGAIKNGSVLQCSLNAGNHEITLKWWQKKKKSVFSFYIPSDMDTVHINVHFSKSTEKFILLSDDVKIENCSCNVNGDNYIVEQNPLHMRISPEEKLKLLAIEKPGISLYEGEVCYYCEYAAALHQKKTGDEYFDGTLYITNIRVILLALKCGFDLYISKITQLLYTDYGFQIFFGSKCYDVMTIDRDNIQELVEFMNNQGVFKDEKWLKEQQKHITSTSSTTLNIKQELSDLKWLLDEGIITQEEFDTKKKQLLGL